MFPRRSRSAFSLLEMVVCLVVVALLAFGAHVSFSKVIDSARVTAAAAQLEAVMGEARALRALSRDTMT